MKCECCLEDKTKDRFDKIELSVGGFVVKQLLVEEICKECLDVKDVKIRNHSNGFGYSINNKPKYNKKMVKHLMGDEYDNYYYGHPECVEVLADIGHKISFSTMKNYTKEYVLQKGFYTREKININMFEVGEQFGWIYHKKEFHKFWDLRINGKFRSVKKSKIEFGSDKLEYLLDKGYYKKHKKENMFWVYYNTVDNYSFCDVCGGKTKIEDFAKATNNCWVWECVECRSKKNKEQYANMSEKDKAELLRKQSEYNQSEAGKLAMKKSDKKRMQDPKHRFSINIRKQLGKSFKENGWSKNTNTYKYIILTKEEFEEHMEAQFTEGMTWDNWTFYGWHLDHRLPLAASKSEEETAMLWHKDNLQPMWAAENIAKGDKHCPKELQAYFEKRKATK